MGCDDGLDSFCTWGKASWTSERLQFSDSVSCDPTSHIYYNDLCRVKVKTVKWSIWVYQNLHLSHIRLFSLLLLLSSLLTETELSLGGSSPYTSTDKTNKNKIYINETIQKHSTYNTKTQQIQVHILPKHPHNCQNTHTLQTHTYIHTHTLQTHTYIHTHTLQNKLKQPQYKIHTKRNIHNRIKNPKFQVTLMYMALLSLWTSP